MSYHQKASQQTTIQTHEEYGLLPEHYQRDPSHRNSGDRMTVINRHHFTIFKKERKALLKKTAKTAHDNKCDAEIAALCALIMAGEKKKKMPVVSKFTGSDAVALRRPKPEFVALLTQPFLDDSNEETMTSD